MHTAVCYKTQNITVFSYNNYNFHSSVHPETNLELNSEYESARDQTLQKVETLTGLHQSFESLTVQSHSLSQKLQPSCLQVNQKLCHGNLFDIII